MIIGVPKEIKPSEYRISMLPIGIEQLAQAGHTVLVEADAGVGSGIANGDYVVAGATLVETSREVFDNAELIVKVKEPLPEEYDLLHEGQVLFTYFHFAANEALTRAMLEKKGHLRGV